VQKYLLEGKLLEGDLLSDFLEGGVLRRCSAKERYSCGANTLGVPPGTARIQVAKPRPRGALEKKVQ
jgi:hypothetical protein